MNKTQKEALDRQSSIALSCRGFQASLMKAPRLKDKGSAYGLPQGLPILSYPVDALPGSPDSWMRGEGSYVCPVSPDCGLWFDWTSNDPLNTAILPSVKGMNPVTGQKLEGLALDRFLEKCPVHGNTFKHGLLCEECGYCWPPQSYVCHPNTLWWDGFRQPDGTVRQFFFTADEQRDIATLQIGKQNTVPAFGFAFFETKTKRVPEIRQDFLRSKGKSSKEFYGLSNKQKTYGGPCGQSIGGGSSPLVDVSGPIWMVPQESKTVDMTYRPNDSISCYTGDESSILSVQTMSSQEVDGEEDLNQQSRQIDVSVGAGAEIRQALVSDPLALSEWKDKPTSVMRLYFVFESEFETIVRKGGVKDIKGHLAGYLKSMPVG